MSSEFFFCFLVFLFFFVDKFELRCLRFAKVINHHSNLPHRRAMDHSYQNRMMHIFHLYSHSATHEHS